LHSTTKRLKHSSNFESDNNVRRVKLCAIFFLDHSIGREHPCLDLATFCRCLDRIIACCVNVRLLNFTVQLISLSACLDSIIVTVYKCSSPASVELVAEICECSGGRGVSVLGDNATTFQLHYKSISRRSFYFYIK